MMATTKHAQIALILALPESAAAMAGPVGVTWQDGTTVVADVHAVDLKGPESVMRRLEAFDDMLEVLQQMAAAITKATEQEVEP